MWGIFAGCLVVCGVGVMSVFGRGLCVLVATHGVVPTHTVVPWKWLVSVWYGYRCVLWKVVMTGAKD